MSIQRHFLAVLNLAFCLPLGLLTSGSYLPTMPFMSLSQRGDESPCITNVETIVGLF